MVWRTLGRLIWIPVAFLLAALLTALVVVTLGLERITQAIGGKWQDSDSLAGLYALVLQGEMLLSGLTLVPALAVVVVGEVARIRSSLYYILGGGAAVVAVPLLASFGGPGGTLQMPAAPVWQVLATAGFAGGWLYWLLAGRRA